MAGSGSGDFNGMSPRDMAEYIFDLLQSLLVVARQDPKVMADLIYLLEMAALEADRIKRDGE